jgi:hypothetical protein
LAKRRIVGKTAESLGVIDEWNGVFRLPENNTKARSSRRKGVFFYR